MKKYLFLLACAIAGSALAEPGYVAMKKEWPVVGQVFNDSSSMHTLYANRPCKLRISNAKDMHEYKFNSSSGVIYGCWLNGFGEKIYLFYTVENKNAGLSIGQKDSFIKTTYVKAEIYKDGSFKVLSEPLKNPFP